MEKMFEAENHWLYIGMTNSETEVMCVLKYGLIGVILKVYLEAALLEDGK